MTGKTPNFDLPLIIRTGDMDVRGVAANNLSLTGQQYFTTLIKILDDMPVVIDVLGRVAGFADKKEDIIILDFMKGLLEQAGCKSYAADMAGILDVIARGKKGLAATRANGMLEDLPEFCKRITAAKCASSQDTQSGIGYQGNKSLSSGATLKELLEQMEYEDAIRKPRILAVDDAEVVLRTVYTVLSNDYTVYRLSKPTMLEKILEHVVPELFLLDYKMPERSGFDLVPIIRNFPEHKETPIIFLTTMGTIDHISTAMLLGACDFMVKPFQPDRLREKVAKHIVKKKI